MHYAGLTSHTYAIVDGWTISFDHYVSPKWFTYSGNKAKGNTRCKFELRCVLQKIVITSMKNLPTTIFLFFLPQKATKPPVLLIEMGNRKRVMPFEVLFSSICCWLYNNCAPRKKRCNVVSCGSSQADYETFNESPI